MQIVVLATEEQKKEILLKTKHQKVNIEFVDSFAELLKCKDAKAFFILNDDLILNQISLITKPVFINSVALTLSDLNTPDNVSRINAWPTFLQRNLWEIATKHEFIVKDIFEKIGWRYIAVPDKPGFISARILAMIINEAYFTWQENISTKEHIDTAMKLGTNYPFGPFEWAAKIGLRNIYDVLKILNTNNERYNIALSIKKELSIE